MLHFAIVEDEERYAAELEGYIRRYGVETSRQIKVTHYQDGEDLVEDYSGGFDLLLMDIQMQFMDGLPVSTKEDRGTHGYGVRSIRYAARKYSGTVAYEQGDEQFSVKILIPKPITQNTRQHLIL